MDSSLQIAALDQLRVCLSARTAEERLLPPRALDRQRWSRLFELCVAYEHGLCLWENLPPSAFETCAGPIRRFMANGGRPKDYGIDCASIDLAHVAQAKWLAPGSSVSWRAVSTFHSLGVAVRSSAMTLATTPSVSVVSLASALPVKQVVMPDVKIDEICQLALDTAPVVKPVAESLVEPAAVPERDTQDNVSLGDLDGYLEEILGTISVEPMLDRGYAWQADAITCLAESLRGSDEAVFASIACGAGKTRVIIEVARQGFLPCVVFVPAIALLTQFEDEVRKWAPNLLVSLVGGGNAFIEGADVTICTYNSAHLLKGHSFELCVVDEAHHCFEEFYENDEDAEGRVYAETIRSLDCKHTLLVSATLPVDETSLHYSFNVNDAVNMGSITDYHLIIPVFTPEGDKRAGIIELIHKHPEWTRILAYCNTVQAAKEFAEMACLAGLPSVAFDAKTSVRQRAIDISALECGQLRMIVSVHTLSEGVDIKSANTAIFIEPRGSPIDVAQCVGRIQRRSPETGKIVAHVVLPSSDEEKDLARFLGLLTKNDHRLANGGWRRSGRTSVFVTNVTNIAEDSEEQRSAAELVSENVFNRLGVLLAGDEAWMAKLALLRTYVEEFGYLPGASTKYKGVNIGSWITNMRNAKKGIELGKFSNKNCMLNATRMKLLEEVSGWQWGRDLKETWNEKYMLLRAYVEEFGQLPVQRTLYRGINLGEWVSGQRQAKKGKGSSKMDTERIILLEKVPQWYWERDIIGLWNQNYELLQAYVEEHNHLPAQKTIYRGVDVGTWVSRMRQAKKGTGGNKMDPSRIIALEKISGWWWEKDPEEAWNEKYELLLSYVKESGRLPGTQTIYKDVKLGSWISQMRRAKKGIKNTSKMDARRIALLESISGWKW
jgi:superfamily II DNA or RNA helicase